MEETLTETRREYLDRQPQRVVWSPLPGSQAFAVSCPCNIIFYEGTRGPGKTDAQLMAFRKLVGQGYGQYWRGVIFDRKYKNLDDLVAKSKKWFYQFGDGAEFKLAKSDYKWVWPTGEELLFRSLEKDDDYWNYHGQEFPFIGWNELTKFATPKLFNDLMSCNRSSFLPAEHSPKDKDGKITKLLPRIPLVVFATSNPYGAGHNWCKMRFVDVALPGQVIRKTINVFNPQTKQREDVVKTQVRLFGSYKENRYLDPIYVAELESVKDENKRKAWLWGDWDIVAGGALDDVWREKIHVLPRFIVPASWRVDRALDWGSTKPYSVGFWAEATGEEIILPNGKRWAPVRGSLIRCHEIYGTTELGMNEGTKEGSTTVAIKIKEVQEKLVNDGWFEKAVRPGPADNSIRDVTDQDSETIADLMSKEGVTWNESDKKPGSRKVGLQLVRDRLEAAIKHAEGKEAGPGLYFMKHCRAALVTLPVLPRDEDDPDDVDTEAEDHVYDEMRYRVLASSNRFATSIKTKFAN